MNNDIHRFGPDGDGEHVDTCVQRITITLELPGGWGTNTIPLAAVIDVLDHLERDGLRPFRTTVDITEQPTT